VYGLDDEVAATGECGPTEVGWCGAACRAADDISLSVFVGSAHGVDSGQ
jgi:hypothetical protein